MKECSQRPEWDYYGCEGLSSGPRPSPGINNPLDDIYHIDGWLPTLHHAQHRHTAYTWHLTPQTALVKNHKITKTVWNSWSLVLLSDYGAWPSYTGTYVQSAVLRGRRGGRDDPQQEEHSRRLLAVCFNTIIFLMIRLKSVLWWTKSFRDNSSSWKDFIMIIKLKTICNKDVMNLL